MKTLILISLLVTSSVFAASSQEERGAKTHELTVQTGFDYRLWTYQLSYMYFLNADNLIGIKAGSGRGNEENQTNFSLQYQSYLGNSFYIAPEIFYLNTHEDINGFVGTLFGLRDMADYTSLGAGIRIGNQWTWKVFTIGCDWVGVGQRVVTFEKETDKLSNTTLTLMNLKIGASF
jgi:hypothetical protein